MHVGYAIDYGFRVAINGALGYEFKVLNLDQNIKSIIKRQIAEYRQYENLILNGDFYRVFFCRFGRVLHGCFSCIYYDFFIYVIDRASHNI